MKRKKQNRCGENGIFRWRIEIWLALAALFVYIVLPRCAFIVNTFLGASLGMACWRLLLLYLPARCAGALRRVFHLLLAVGLGSFLILEGLIFAGMQSEASKDCDYVIILGAGLSGDGPSVSLLGRLDAALAFLRQNPQAKAIASGGVGKESVYSEAEVMKWYLMEHGIAEERILKEEAATRTDENFKFGKQAAQAYYGEKITAVVIATSDYHMFRSRLLAKKYFSRVYAVAAPSPLDIRLNYAVREYFALLKMGLLESADWLRSVYFVILSK